MAALTLLVLTSVHLLVALTPIAAGVAAAMAFGVRSRLLLLMFGLSALGVLGALTFWTYLFSPTLGRPVALSILLLCLAYVIQRTRIEYRARRLSQLKDFAPPVAVFATSCVFNVFLGYLRGGLNLADATAQYRYVARLPVDNRLPLVLAQQVQSHVRPLPDRLIGLWQAGDRPPLQTGAYLLQQSVFGSNWFVHYEIIGVICQSLWIFGVWGFCRAAWVSNKVTALVLAVTAFSGFAIVNTFFTWPKLFPAAYLMLVAAAVLTPALEEMRRKVAAPLAVGLCLGLSVFGHPGSAMVVIALVITVVVLRRVPSRRFVIGSIVTAAVVYVPWVLFQRLYQPPGDRLMKWQLAGPQNIEQNKSLLANVADAYRPLSVGDIVSNKLHNLSRPFEDTFRYPHQILRLIRIKLFDGGGHQAALTVAHIKALTFYSITVTLGLMAVGVLIAGLRSLQLLVTSRHGHRTRVNDESIRVAGRSIICLAVNLIVWAGVLFGPGSTIIHDGSYFVELLAFVVGVIGWYAISPRWATVAVVVQAILVLYIYGVALPIGAGARDPKLYTVQLPQAVGSVVALGLLVAALVWVWRTPDGSAAEISQPADGEVLSHSAEHVVEHRAVAGRALEPGSC
jgi:hypothetical protein